jgi:hypothetical protein
MESTSEAPQPIQVVDFDISTPVDIKKATEILCGCPSIFYTMLSKFEEMTFLNRMELIAEDVNNGNMEKYGMDATKLKCPAGYIGASHVHYACAFI